MARGVHFQMSNLPPEAGEKSLCGPDRVLLQIGPYSCNSRPLFCRQIKRRNVEKLKERFRVPGHPFGTVKFYDGVYYSLCKGKEKVAAETALMFTAYNIRRAISLAGGVQNLIRKMSAATPKPKLHGYLRQFKGIAAGSVHEKDKSISFETDFGQAV